MKKIWVGVTYGADGLGFAFPVWVILLLVSVVLLLLVGFASPPEQMPEPEQPVRLYRVVEGKTVLELQQELNRLGKENCNPILMGSYRGAYRAVVVLECIDWR